MKIEGFNDDKKKKNASVTGFTNTCTDIVRFKFCSPEVDKFSFVPRKTTSLMGERNSGIKRAGGMYLTGKL